MHLPADHIVGEDGRGFSYAMAALDGGRIGIGAQAVGIARRALEHAVAYCAVRGPMLAFQYARETASFHYTGFAGIVA